MKIKDILSRKGGKVVTLRSDQCILEAAQEMVRHKIGAILVVNEDNAPIGIFSERDFTRMVALEGCDSQQTALSEAMTSELLVGFPEDDVEDTLSLMTEKRFRHLPIMEGGKLAGIVSQGDIVKEHAKHHQFEAHYLRDYVTGKIS